MSEPTKRVKLTAVGATVEYPDAIHAASNEPTPIYASVVADMEAQRPTHRDRPRWFRWSR